MLSFELTLLQANHLRLLMNDPLSVSGASCTGRSRVNIVLIWTEESPKSLEVSFPAFGGTKGARAIVRRRGRSLFQLLALSIEHPCRTCEALPLLSGARGNEQTQCSLNGFTNSLSRNGARDQGLVKTSEFGRKQRVFWAFNWGQSCSNSRSKMREANSSL